MLFVVFSLAGQNSGTPLGPAESPIVAVMAGGQGEEAESPEQLRTLGGSRMLSESS